MKIKLTLERFVASPTGYAWRFRQEPYTRQEWETFNIPCMCGVAGVFCAYITENDDVDEWKEKLKQKAFQEMQNSIENIMQQIESLGEYKVNWELDISEKSKETMRFLGNFSPTVIVQNREIKGWIYNEDDNGKVYLSSSELREIAVACEEVATWLDKRAETIL